MAYAIIRSEKKLDTSSNEIETRFEFAGNPERTHTMEVMSGVKVMRLSLFSLMQHRDAQKGIGQNS
jgi:hypothetical protein